jgi:AraC-like DNA-binding protein
LDLLQSSQLIARDWQAIEFDQWADELHSICGNFLPVGGDQADLVTGAARGIDVGGMKFAHVSNNLERVQRTMEDIRKDQQEHLFLIVQIEGQCGIEQLGREHQLDVGDCILVDSTKPSTFHFGGHFSNHLSMHLPRQTMYSDARIAFNVAHKLECFDPMAIMLRALIAKVMSSQQPDANSPQLRELVFSATRQAFVTQDVEGLTATNDTTFKRLEMVNLLIDRHLTDSQLGAKWLAMRLGVSIRTLQEDFQGLGVTCTTVIRDRRLRLARERIEQIKDQGAGKTIAEVAYSTGFNDISYFNRSFKELFDCSPRELLRH